MPESSIIIPVYNKFELTEGCLRRLGETVYGRDIEVIVIDNASTDETQEYCPRFGKIIFGDSFCYHRCEQNINFGPASNLGAQMAKGQYLIFLNNDTWPQDNWYQPLLDDFRNIPNLAATGPLLTYARCGPLGEAVQHLGVYVSALKKVDHLYQAIPAASPLAHKRRFFQIITAACMMIPRQLFLDSGQFDEKFVNGLEDVELCARLSLAGYKLTVNPQARIFHAQGASRGGDYNEIENSRYLDQTCFR